MHLQQHDLCTRKTELALEVKFYGDECWPTEVTSNTYFRGVGFDPKKSKGRELPKCLKWVCSTTVVGAKGFVYLRFGSVCVCICVFIWREIPIFSSQGPLWYLSGHRSCWAGSVGIGTYKAISVETCKCAATSQNMCFWSYLPCRAPTWEKELWNEEPFSSFELITQRLLIFQLLAVSGTPRDLGLCWVPCVYHTGQCDTYKTVS